ncbi:MAG: 1-deoxy-D-xylulose-5-phosphate reductoisomerase, partial [Candidatus Wildermuthbacteria bacterium]|nr:1-deoxy-D-xylulose-5-phosphate reductoisomerase [Candidatus Wildermuthbacteria bacterium]
IDLKEIKNLSFSEPDMTRFPCLDIAYRAAKLGGSAPEALVFADEIVVNKFLGGEIKFSDIPGLIRQEMRQRIKNFL